MYAQKSSLEIEPLSFKNILQLCQDQSIMLLHATVEKKF